jgi:DNA-binding transcriptional MerR regulator
LRPENLPLDLALTATFTLLSRMEVRRLRKRLRIGEVARLIGVTTKTVRHYEKVGLLGESERSEAGYRLYAADDLLRLQRIRHLQSLGLSLDRIKGVLGEPGSGAGLRDVLESLLAEVEGQVGTLERRRDRIREVLAKEDPEAPQGEPRAMKLAEEHLGEHLKEASPSLIEQERKMWATLEAFEWPEEYANVQESLVRYYARNPEEYRAALALEERLVLLTDLPEDSPEVEALVDDYARYVETSPLTEELRRGPRATHEALGAVFLEIATSGMSPAQLRFFGLFGERLAATESGDAG